MSIPVDEFYEVASDKKEGLCVVKFCRCQRGGRSRLCHGHRMAKWRAEHPIRTAFNGLRDSARRRKIDFRLSIEEFREFVKGNDYIEERGCTQDALQMDRIDGAGAYEIGNLQILTTSENTAKGNQERWGEGYRKELLRRKGYLEEEEIPTHKLPIDHPDWTPF